MTALPALPAFREPGAAPGATRPATVHSDPPDTTARRVFSGALAVFVLIAVARVHTVVGGVFGVIPFAKLAMVLIVVAAYVAFRREDFARLLRTSTGRAFAAIVVLAFLSAPFGVWQGNSVAGLLGPFLPVIALFVLGAVGLAADRRTLQTCMTAMAVGVGIGALFVLRGSEQIAGRAMLGGGLDPNDSAALLVAAIPIALTIASGRGIGRRLLFGAIALVAVAALVKTGSRGGMLGLVAMALSLVIIVRGRQRMNYLAVILIGGLIFSVSAQEQLRERFAATFEQDYNQTDEDGRIQVWKRGIGYMTSNPVLGVGFLNFSAAEGMLSSKATDPNRRRGVKYTAAHNSFVQIGAELGVGGLVAFTAMILTALAGCWRIARRRDPADDPFFVKWAGTGFVSLFGITVSATFLSLAYTPMLIVIVTLCTGVILGAARAREQALAGGGLETSGIGAQDAGAAVVPTGWRSRRSGARVPRTAAPRAPRTQPAWRSARRGGR
jgi:O-antigen ligase